ncbi:nuclear transport factor 2 family protein [Streptomyces sp. L7]
MAGVRAVLGAQHPGPGRRPHRRRRRAVHGRRRPGDPGHGPGRGRDAIHAAFKGWEPVQPQLHLVTNTVVTSTGEDEARALSDVAFLQRGEAGWAIGVVGHYDDTLRHQDGTWLLHRRKTTYQASTAATGKRVDLHSRPWSEMTTTIDPSVTAAVQTAIAAYAQALDAGRTDDIAALYTADGVAEIVGMAKFEGREAIRQGFGGFSPQAPQLHLIANTVVTSATEDEATATSNPGVLRTR